MKDRIGTTFSAETEVAVLNPGWVEAVELNKAGLMGVVDIFVINKTDCARSDTDFLS